MFYFTSLSVLWIQGIIYKRKDHKDATTSPWWSRGWLENPTDILNNSVPDNLTISTAVCRGPICRRIWMLRGIAGIRWQAAWCHEVMAKGQAKARKTLQGGDCSICTYILHDYRWALDGYFAIFRRFCWVRWACRKESMAWYTLSRLIMTTLLCSAAHGERLSAAVTIDISATVTLQFSCVSHLPQLSRMSSRPLLSSLLGGRGPEYFSLMSRNKKTATTDPRVQLIWPRYKIWHFHRRLSILWMPCTQEPEGIKREILKYNL